MKYYIFIYYIVSYSTGIAGLCIMFLLYLKLKAQAILYYIMWLAAFTGLLVLQNIEYYRITIMSKYDTYSTFITIFLYNSFFGIMFYFMPLFFHKIAEKQFSLAHRIIFGLLPAAALFFFFYPYLFKDFERIKMIIFSFKSMSWIMIGLIAFILAFLLLNLKKVRNTGKRLIMKFSIVMFFLSIPIIVIEYSWNFNLTHFIRPLSITNFFYFIFNLFSIIFINKYIFAKHVKSLAADITDNFAVQYHITSREKMIMTMMAQGLSNKEIAYELGITSMTVKNHIYNIYQKTGSKSKVEMLILMKDHDHDPLSNIASILS